MNATPPEVAAVLAEMRRRALAGIQPFPSDLEAFADEIEAALSQQAEPVAWQMRRLTGFGEWTEWHPCGKETEEDHRANPCGLTLEFRALYTHPAQPAAVPVDMVLVARKDAEAVARFAFNNAGKGLRAPVAAAGERILDSIHATAVPVESLGRDANATWWMGEAVEALDAGGHGLLAAALATLREGIRTGRVVNAPTAPPAPVVPDGSDA